MSDDRQQGYLERLDAKFAASPPDEAFEWQIAREDALKSLRDMRDPAEFAAMIEPRHREALSRAWQSNDGWKAQPEDVRELRLLGLVEVGGNWKSTDNPRCHSRNHLTAFGMKVRRIVTEAF